jgi:hypothetical protein
MIRRTVDTANQVVFSILDDNGASCPGGAKNVGQMFFNSTLNKPLFWNGTAWVDATGTIIAWGVTLNLTNLIANNTAAANANNNYATNLFAFTGYQLPTTITVSMGGTELTAGTDYTYDNSTGAVRVRGTGGSGGVTGALVITAIGETV